MLIVEDPCAEVSDPGRAAIVSRGVIGVTESHGLGGQRPRTGPTPPARHTSGVRLPPPPAYPILHLWPLERPRRPRTRPPSGDRSSVVRKANDPSPGLSAGRFSFI